jgi:hypothetical protein
MGGPGDLVAGENGIVGWRSIGWRGAIRVIQDIGGRGVVQGIGSLGSILRNGREVKEIQYCR